MECLLSGEVLRVVCICCIRCEEMFMFHLFAYILRSFCFGVIDMHVISLFCCISPGMLMFSHLKQIAVAFPLCVADEDVLALDVCTYVLCSFCTLMCVCVDSSQAFFAPAFSSPMLEP